MVSDDVNKILKVFQRKDFFQRLLDVVPIPIFYEDVNGRYLGCNKAYAEFMGKDVEDILFRTVLDVVHPDQAEELFERDKKLLAEGGFTSDERKILHHDGTYHTVILNKTVFFDESGNVAGLIGAFLDITEISEARKREQQYLKKLQSLSAALAREREKERRRVAQKIHDSIGQNLAFSKLKLQMLCEDVKNNESLSLQIRKVISAIDDSIQSTKDLTFDLGIPILYQLGFEATLSWLKDKFYNRYGLEVRYVYGELPKGLSMELEAFLFRALRELLMNVVKHAKTAFAEVKVALDDTGMIVMEVRDSGRGFDVDTLESNAVEKQCYGLFALQETLKLIGGYVTVSSREYKGTTVTLYVPACAFDGCKEEGGEGE